MDSYEAILIKPPPEILSTCWQCWRCCYKYNRPTDLFCRHCKSIDFESVSEEDVIVLLECSAELLRFDDDSHEWSSHGNGKFKILMMVEDTSNVRLLWYSEIVLKLCCHQHIANNSNFSVISDEDLSVKWHNIDYSDNNINAPQEKILGARFESTEMCQEFLNVVQMLQPTMTAVIDHDQTIPDEDHSNGAISVMPAVEPVHLGVSTGHVQQHSILLDILKFNHVNQPLNTPFAAFANLDQRLINQLTRMGITMATQSQQQLLQRSTNRQNILFAPHGSGKTLAIILFVLNEVFELNSNKTYAIFCATNSACVQAFKLAVDICTGSGIGEETDFHLVTDSTFNQQSKIMFGTFKYLESIMRDNNLQPLLIFDDADVYLTRKDTQKFVHDYWDLVRIIISPLEKFADVLDDAKIDRSRRNADIKFIRPLENGFINELVVYTKTIQAKLDILDAIRHRIDGQMLIFCQVNL